MNGNLFGFNYEFYNIDKKTLSRKGCKVFVSYINSKI